MSSEQNNRLTEEEVRDQATLVRTTTSDLTREDLERVLTRVREISEGAPLEPLQQVYARNLLFIGNHPNASLELLDQRPAGTFGTRPSAVFGEEEGYEVDGTWEEIFDQDGLHYLSDLVRNIRLSHDDHE